VLSHSQYWCRNVSLSVVLFVDVRASFRKVWSVLASLTQSLMKCLLGLTIPTRV